MVLEKIKLKDMIRSGQKELALEENYDYEDLPLKTPVRLQIHCKLNATGLDLQGHFEAVIEEPCDRCCEPYERTLMDNFEERFVYQSLVDEAPAGDMELHNEDFYDVIGPEGILDLKDLLHQYVVIAMSADRVCNRDSCEIKG